MAVFHRDPCGICCIILTYIAVIYADYCIVNHVIIPTISQSLWGTIHVIIFNIIALLLLMSHFRASFSDPGVVPLPTNSLDFSEINKARNPENGDSEWTPCTKCEAYRPPRAHHCRICRRCIKKMDRHCLWINNCVGESNQKFFVLFLFYTGLLSIYAIILIAVSWTKECLGCPKEYEKRTRYIYTIILMIESCLFGLFVMATMCDQFSSITEDLTAIENVQKKIRTNRKPRTALLAEVFGRGSFFLWFCPCTSSNNSGKRQKDSNLVSESESKPRKKDRRDVNNINQQNVSYKSIPESTESMDASSFYDTTPMDSRAYNMPSQVSTEMLAENVIEVEVDFNKKPSEELDATGIPKVLEAEFALRNTNGGVIQLKMKSGLAQNVAGKKLDQWKISLNAKRQDRLKELGIKEKIAEILDFRLEYLLIYVRKSSIILTEESNLLERRETEKHTLQSYFEIHNMLEKNNETLRCCCKDAPEKEHFAFGRQMSIGESVTVEYKHLTSKKLPDRLRSEVKEYIVQFANTSGGFVYFGIADDGIIKGQKISGEEKRAICHKLHACMESKIWVSKTGDRDTPVRGSHYQVNFFSVYGADETTFVIEVHICQYAGTVFLKEPVCMTVNEDNKLVKMDFKKWLSTFLKSTTLTISNRGYRNRFERRERGTSAYFSVKETVEKFVDDLKSALPGHLKVHPVHAMNWIHHQTLNMFVELIKKKFKENSFRGVAYIERCWEVNLGLPCTKPADVICDLLLCSPQMPLVLVSLTSDIPNEITSMYNKKVAKKLKATLVQEAGCLEKFYVKPITISHQWLESAENVSSIYSDMPEYPDTYRMSEDKYTKILEALVLVLARANIMATHVIGQGLFNLLTYEQYKILHEFYENSNKVKITGPPGSGKTVLALERMHRLRKSGCSYDEVFFLCSYKPLKARVGNITMPHDGKPLCIAKTYYEFAPLIESEENVHPTLDNVKHILADEAQNFQDFQETSLDWWSKLNGMCDKMKDSSFWVFFDPSQKVNNKRSVSLREFSQNNLKTVIRTTGEIHWFITGQKYMSVGTDVKLGHDLEGEKVEVLVPLESFLVEKSKHLVYILISQLHKLIIDDGYNENRITVLFTSIADRNEYQKLFLEQTSNCSVRNGEELSKSGVIFDTIRRYSGEENDIIIGFCPEYYTSGAQNNNALMVSLCSRAKFKLILIFKNETVAINFNLKGWKNVEYGN